eukprot:gene32315-39082_t
MSIVSDFGVAGISSRRRNYMLTSHRRDGLIEWMKEMLNHSFVLDAKESYVGTMHFIEELIEEHRENPTRSRLKQFVPTVGVFHTPLPLGRSFMIYDNKYSITKRRFISPSFNEIRHILNLAQITAIGESLQLITFDGDQTLYSDGGNFDARNDELALGIISLLCNDVKVAMVTAAGYGFDGSKYEKRVQGLLDRFIQEEMTGSQISNFHLFGGECNYLFRCELVAQGEEKPRARLIPIPVEEWQGDHIATGPKPYKWPQEQITSILDIAEESMKDTIKELKLRAKILRKERAVGVFPGGVEMVKAIPEGHGSNKLKREALDELVLRVVDSIRVKGRDITLPFCVFNGGSDAWLDIGNKSVAVATLQAYFNLPNAHCLHVGDQFLNTGNDIAAREVCPCIWIINPRETGKVLQHVLRHKKITPIASAVATTDSDAQETEGKPVLSSSMNIYTGL